MIDTTCTDAVTRDVEEFIILQIYAGVTAMAAAER